MTQTVTITGFSTRKEVAAIIQLSERSLYNLLSSEKFKDLIPKGDRLSPAHQQLIFEHCGIPCAFVFVAINTPTDTNTDTEKEAI